MIKVFAETYMIAARTEGLDMVDVPRKGVKQSPLRRLFRKPVKRIDPAKL